MQYLENDRIKVAVADHGAELCGIYDKKRGHEVVWQADPKYWNRHAPVLFPFVGKVCGGQYRYKGVSYPMGHVTYVLKSNEETLAKYPFEFELEITHRIEENKVFVEWKVTNPSKSEPLYFSIGAHPAFNVPVLPGTAKDDYYVFFEGKDELEYVFLDPVAEAADAEHPHKLVLDHGYMPVTMDLFDNDAYIFDHGQVGGRSPRVTRPISALSLGSAEWTTRDLRASCRRSSRSSARSPERALKLCTVLS